ncbi:MAG: 2-amino-4-hydroxy-6-hydroxymethyldihydropteridine diphosphokinase, partial [Sedimenticolaceae bacterium]
GRRMSAAGVPAFVGLGSNLEKPIQQVRTALRELGELPGTRRVRHSHLYRSAPLGPPGQPDYINAVVMLLTSLDAHALLDELQALEHRHGRVRNERWGPRTLDLDLLLFGEARFDSPRLSVPHPQMHRRAFVLVPLHDVAPGIDLPDLGPLADHVRRMSGHGLQVVGADEDD